jgi:hypothetical protein
MVYGNAGYPDGQRKPLRRSGVTDLDCFGGQRPPEPRGYRVAGDLGQAGVVTADTSMAAPGPGVYR